LHYFSGGQSIVRNYNASEQDGKASNTTGRIDVDTVGV
jgi:hypothetical protein